MIRSRYCLAPELLSAGSLNSAPQVNQPWKKFNRDLVVKLSFRDTRNKAQIADDLPNAIPQPRLALVLGRLKATHHHPDFKQSHWVLVVDESLLLWALYTENVDANDVEPLQKKVRPYKIWDDTAFGADRVQERVVRLGAIDNGNIPFNSRKEMYKVQVRLLNWSTEPNDGVVGESKKRAREDDDEGVALEGPSSEKIPR